MRWFAADGSYHEFSASIDGEPAEVIHRRASQIFDPSLRPVRPIGRPMTLSGGPDEAGADLLRGKSWPDSELHGEEPMAITETTVAVKLLDLPEVIATLTTATDTIKDLATAIIDAQFAMDGACPFCGRYEAHNDDCPVPRAEALLAGFAEEGQR